MLKFIDTIKKKPIRFIKDFIQNCTVEEKIDTYYVTFSILGKNKFAFYKSNGKKLERTDLILNEMWDKMMRDWLYFYALNKEWFEAHIGYKINLFYFPCRKPIMTEYKDDVNYVISRIVTPSGDTIDDPEQEMKDMLILDKLKIHFKHNLKMRRINNWAEENNKILDILRDKSDMTLSDYFESLVIPNRYILFAQDEPEGYVFKWGKNNKYQIVKTSLEERASYTVQQQTQYEYLLIDFIKFYNAYDGIESQFSMDYITTVCNLFDLYIRNWEQETNNIKNNIEPNSLQNPYVGHRFDICYRNIPDTSVAMLCVDDELYKNIFKILLVNLKKLKNPERQYMLMTERQVKQWNDIVTCIRNVTVPDSF